MGLVDGAAERTGAYLVLRAAEPDARGPTEPPAPAQQFREICHDMRQPVAGVLSLAAAALTVPELPSTARARLEQIVAEAQTLAELIEQSLHQSDPEARTAQTDLGQLASQVAAGERLTYQGLLRMTAPGRPVLANINHVDARRIIANLLSNATRAAGPDGCVTVRVARGHDCAQLSVLDSGPGFAKIPRSTGLGTGVIARCLARSGGQIDYGRSPDGGVKATVSLPLASG
jgi:signal transduction histidine kinase